MAHPITKHRRAFLFYTSIWIFVAIVQGFIILYTSEIGYLAAFSDAFISNILFGALGLMVWYPTRYIPFQKQAPIYSISAHIAAGLLVILVWMTLSMTLLGVLFTNDPAYSESLSSSIFWRAIIGIFVYLVLVLGYYLIINSRSLQERAKAEERLRTLVKESELNMLKAQINPHFLFNSLNSVSSLIMSNPEEAQEMILKLSDFIRYSLMHRENEYVPLKEEIGRMEDYLAIEKVRFGEKLSYTLETDNHCDHVEVPTMILQPLIENAIKHGVYESLDPVEILFNGQINESYLELLISNDFDPQHPSRKGTGVGLQNVSERIRLAYDEKGSFQWKIDGDKFIVNLRIPVNK